MQPYILLKSDKVLEGLLKGKYPELLIEMALITIKKIRSFGCQVVVTSSYREGDTGVHGFFRGLGFRTHELTQEQIQIILEDINSKYIYDPSRPEMEVIIFHDTGKGPHLHLQSHPNTQWREQNE